MKEVSILSFILFFVYFFLGGAVFSYAIHRRQKALFYLTASFILRAIILLGPSLIIYNIPIKWTVWVTGPIKVSLIPLTYLFVENLFKNEKKLNVSNLWHFIPLAFDYILTAYVAVFHVDNMLQGAPIQGNLFGTSWEGNFYYNLLATTARAISMLQAIFYSTAMFPRIRNQIINQKIEYSQINHRFFRWTKGVVVMFILTGIFEAAALTGIYQFPIAFLSWFLFLIFNALFLFFYVVIFPPEKINTKQSKLTLFNKSDPIQENKTEIEKGEWLQEFIKRKLFLNPELTLQRTAAELNIPKYKLTQFIKNEGYSNFYSFVNYFRVEKSMVLLKNIPDSQVIESVATDSGFNSRSTFFRVFKETTGITPGEFLQKQLKDEVIQAHPKNNY